MNSRIQEKTTWVVGEKEFEHKINAEHYANILDIVDDFKLCDYYSKYDDTQEVLVNFMIYLFENYDVVKL